MVARIADDRAEHREMRSFAHSSIVPESMPLHPAIVAEQWGDGLMNDEMTVAAGDEGIGAYVSRHFWPMETLARASGVSEQEAGALIGGGCAPGFIYAFDDNGWWSALGGYWSGAVGDPGNSARRWFGPAAARSVRRARLALRDCASIAEAAAGIRAQFQAEFAVALQSVPEAPNAFPSCFHADGTLDPGIADTQAAREWVVSQFEFERLLGSRLGA
jgi:hypothetical protein